MSLFVGRLPLNAQERDLDSAFGRYGRITRCAVKTGGYGFVEFSDRRDAEDALRELNGLFS